MTKLGRKQEKHEQKIRSKQQFDASPSHPRHKPLVPQWVPGLIITLSPSPEWCVLSKHLSEAKRGKSKKEGCPLRHCKCCLQHLFCFIIDKWNWICPKNKYKSPLLSHLITFLQSRMSADRMRPGRKMNLCPYTGGSNQSWIIRLQYWLRAFFATYVTQHQLWMQMNSSKRHFPSAVQVSNSCWGTHYSMEGPRARLWSLNNWGLAAATAKIAICCMQAFPVRGTEQSPKTSTLCRSHSRFISRQKISVRM